MTELETDLDPEMESEAQAIGAYEDSIIEAKPFKSPTIEYKILTERWTKFVEMLNEYIKQWWRVEWFSTSQWNTWITYSVLIYRFLFDNEKENDNSWELNSVF